MNKEKEVQAFKEDLIKIYFSIAQIKKNGVMAIDFGSMATELYNIGYRKVDKVEKEMAEELIKYLKNSCADFSLALFRTFLKNHKGIEVD